MEEGKWWTKQSREKLLRNISPDDGTGLDLNTCSWRRRTSYLTTLFNYTYYFVWNEIEWSLIVSMKDLDDAVMGYGARSDSWTPQENLIIIPTNPSEIWTGVLQDTTLQRLPSNQRTEPFWHWLRIPEPPTRRPAVLSKMYLTGPSSLVLQPVPSKHTVTTFSQTLIISWLHVHYALASAENILWAIFSTNGTRIPIVVIQRCATIGFKG